MEILHFKDLVDTASVVTNAVVLVLGVSNFNTNVPQTNIGKQILINKLSPKADKFCNVYILYNEWVKL